MAEQGAELGRVPVELVKPVYVRLKMVGEWTGATHSQVVDEALACLLESKGMTYEELVNQQLAVVVSGPKR